MSNAQEIMNQISTATRMEIGARDWVATESGLQFAVGTRKGEKVTIELTERDDYTVRLWKITRDYNVVELKSFDGVYCDNLNDVLRGVLCNG